MKAKYFFQLLLLIAMSNSCGVVSLNPHYTDDSLIEDNRIIGTWENIEDDYIWEIWKPDSVKIEDSIFGENVDYVKTRFYLARGYLRYEPENWAEFKVHLLKIGKYTYADIFPYDWEQPIDYLNSLLVPVHVIARISIDTTLKLDFIDQDPLNIMIENGTVRKPFIIDSEGKTIFTSKPEDLQELILKLEDNEENVYEEFVWQLRRIEIDKKEKY
jgi:hypothetical protein